MSPSPPAVWPTTDDGWTEAIRAAVFCLALDSCYAYGLMTGPWVDVARCEAVLGVARATGRPVPTIDEVVVPR